MKTPLRSSSLRILASITVAAAAVLLGGCLEKNIVWSPDGQRAAVLSEDNLRFCSPDGTLTEPALPGAYVAAWLHDSQRLLVAREHPAANWTEVARLLGAERAQKIATEAEALWAKIPPGAASNEKKFPDGPAKGLQGFYLRETRAAELRGRLTAGEWDELAKSEVKVHEVLLARLENGHLTTAAPLYTGLEKVHEVRLAPGERSAAIVTADGSDHGDRGRLLVAALDGSALPVLVATGVASFPDWTPNGRSLVYLQSSGSGEKDQMQLGVWQQREVASVDGKIALAEKAQDLGGGIFSAISRVRCLPDGRILFNSTELTLPVAASDTETEREQWFSLDPARLATLVRLVPRSSLNKLPKMLAFFEPSADGKTLLVGGGDGEVCLFTLATGDVEEIQGSGGSTGSQPVWRGPDEFTYLKRTEAKAGELSFLDRAEAKDGKKPARKFEVVLRHGKTETVLSRTWSDAVLEGLGK